MFVSFGSSFTGKNTQHKQGKFYMQTSTKINNEVKAILTFGTFFFVITVKSGCALYPKCRIYEGRAGMHLHLELYRYGHPPSRCLPKMSDTPYIQERVTLSPKCTLLNFVWGEMFLCQSRPSLECRLLARRVVVVVVVVAVILYAQSTSCESDCWGCLYW